MLFNSTEELIADIRAGKMVIVADDEDRENEGDLIMAAQMVTPQAINFMATYGRGLICTLLAPDMAQKLSLQPMVAAPTNPHAANFAVTVEAACGVTSGIGAQDRCCTIKAMVADDAKPQDLVSPGHTFPVIAHPDGVLGRRGHTEAACDLAALAGFKPAGVLVEILNEDGTMARRPQLQSLAHKCDLKIGTIADLVAYRLQLKIENKND